MTKIYNWINMIIDEKIIEMGMHNFTLNKAQFKILGQEDPPIEGWESLVIGKEISEKDVDLFLLLKGMTSLTKEWIGGGCEDHL